MGEFGRQTITEKETDHSVNSPPTLKKNWTLTPEAFGLLLAQLDPDPETAGAQYVLLQRKLVRFFEWSHAQQPADELTERVFDVVARKLIEGEAILNFPAYCHEVARRLLKESFKTPQRVEWGVWADAELTSPSRIEEAREKETRLVCLEECLRQLPTEGRALLEEFYRGTGRDRIQRRQALADRLGIARNALGNRVQRLLHKLEQCVRRCLPW